MADRASAIESWDQEIYLSLEQRPLLGSIVKDRNALSFSAYEDIPHTTSVIGPPIKAGSIGWA